MFTTAVEDEPLARNPCVLKGASVERHDERPIADVDVDVDQIAALADGVEPTYRAMLLLALVQSAFRRAGRAGQGRH